jgi:pimeloyl-ACP methyl ester carboxylesterase
MTPRDHLIDVGIKLHVREWVGDKTAFVLLHGLASNSRTWDAVAERLAAAGHHVVAVDQRGHGLSDKAEEGYGFATITSDLARLLHVMELKRPILIGQSWAGNTLLEFGARYPGQASGLGFVDGGFIDLQARADATWEQVSAQLKPPDLNGMPREALERNIKTTHPDWSEEGIEATLANYQTLPDGSVRPWLALSHHMAILRAMYEQRPRRLYPLVREPVLVCVARDQKNPEWTALKTQQVFELQAGLASCEVHWFEDTDHDIHVQRPEALGALFLQTLHQGVWSK